MASGRDYYDILGVKRDASHKDIRQAYRRLARKHHPDVNPGDKSAGTRFKEIQEAYDVVGDKEKRAKYDQFGGDWEQAGSAGPGGGFGQAGQRGGYQFDFGSAQGDAFDLGSVFEGLFGRSGARGSGRQAARSRRGRDVEHRVEVTLEEAYAGTQRLLQMQTVEPCTQCGGSGVSQNRACPECAGAGSVSRPRRLEVKIPAGVRDGSRVRVGGEGEGGSAGGAKGDLFLVVAIAPHPVFQRKGDDLHVDVSVPLTSALLGGEALVPTLKSRVALKLPAETQNGRVFKLTGQGMPHLLAEGHGDLYAKVNVVLPTKLSGKERELLQELASLRSS